eukprot:Rhum_TRINITY_DN13596_c1_g1::Rhum_TRINITY_DN13596_c1_g1_i2::g.61608::m.61608/K16750/BLOC1S2; biogenesis of lysosome-related organelles complex 1 subunit 2
MPGDEAGVAPAAGAREPLSSKEMFSSVQRIVAGEVQANQEDVTCLREVCEVLTESYDSMERRTGVLQESLVELQKDYQEIQPHFAQIDALDISLSALEQVVAQLETHSLKLEKKITTNAS